MCSICTCASAYVCVYTVCLRVCLAVHSCVCIYVPVSAFLACQFFFVCVLCAQIHILSQIVEVKMWLPAAIKRRQQLENKCAGGGATRTAAMFPSQPLF